MKHLMNLAFWIIVYLVAMVIDPGQEFEPKLFGGCFAGYLAVWYVLLALPERKPASAGEGS